MIVVTGTGRSGTTLAAQVLRDAGLPLHGSKPRPPVHGGMEYEPAATLNDTMLAHLAHRAPTLATDTELAERFGASIRGREWPDFKDPRLCWTLGAWAQCVDIELVVLCVRPAPSVIASGVAAGTETYEPVSHLDPDLAVRYMQARVGYLIETVAHYGLDHVVLPFPAMAEDFAPWGQLTGWLDFDALRQAWEQCADTGLVRHGP